MTAIFQALLLGFLFSVPPGPSGTKIMRAAARADRKEIWNSIFGVMGSDFLMILVFLIFLGSVPSAAFSLWLKAGGGIFLVVFSVIELKKSFSKKKDDSIESPISTFSLNLLNPAAWLAALSVLGLFSSASTTTTIGSILAFEIGVLAWYGSFSILFGKISSRFQFFFIQSALVSIAVMGISSVFQLVF